ncbi:MAG: hypothetical protein H6739_09685 [Alphaproteobacteria bacterium]|nr:hypothetical protein [Alphaproteobacteria bacterium]
MWNFCALLIAWVVTAAAQTPPEPAKDDAPARVVVWFDRGPPAEPARLKAERSIGGEALHVSGAQLAFPPQPWNRRDAEALGRVAGVLRDGQQKWQEFEVELGIARDLDLAIEQVGVLRDASDRDALILALMWQGASVNLAFRPEDFPTSNEAAAFRLDLPGLAANQPLLDALALDPSRTFTKGELPEADSFRIMQELTAALKAMPRATLVTGTLPEGASLMVDGVATTPVDGAVELVPGHHYVHLLVNGVIAGRSEIDAYPGASVDLPFLVSDRERGESERVIESGVTTGLPEDVQNAIAQISGQYPSAEVYLGAVTGDGRVVVLPFSGGARIEEKRPVTFTFGAEIGGSLISSPSFYYARPEGRTQGENINTPAATGALDLELGIYNFAVLAGAEIYITPLEELVYGTGEPDATSADNYYTVVHTKITGGLGAYLLRPTRERRPTMLVGANYGWFSPGHLGGGGRVTFGIPMDKRNHFKLTVHGWYGQPISGYPADEPLFAGGIRLGFQSSI